MRFIARLVGSLLLLVGVACSAQVTLTGNFVDSFSAAFAPQVTFHPLQLYSTNGSTPLYVDRVLRPNTTNASYSYSTSGAFTVSNLVCGLWQVSAIGTSQSLYINAQLGTTLTNFNGILTNNFLYTNSGLSLVAGSNIEFTFANGGVLTISSPGGGGGAAGVTATGAASATTNAGVVNINVPLSTATNAIPTNGPPNTVIVYDGNGNAVGTNVIPISFLNNAPITNSPYVNGTNIGAAQTFQWNPPYAPVNVLSGSVGAGGSVDVGTWQYRVTFVTAVGETEMGPIGNNVTTTSGNQAVTLSGIDTSSDARVIQRNIYRGTQSPPYFIFVSNINDNVTTTFLDKTPYSSLAAEGWQNKADSVSGFLYRNTNLVGKISPYQTVLGYGAMPNLGSNALGFDSTAIGNGALGAGSNIVNDTAVGSFALNAKALGGADSAFGVHALQFDVNSTGMTALGEAALENVTSGNFDTAVGSESFITAGGGGMNYGTAIGALAGYNMLGDGSIALGYKSLYYDSVGYVFAIDSLDRSSQQGEELGSPIFGTINIASNTQVIYLNGIVTVRQGLTVDGSQTTGPLTIASDAASGTQLTIQGIADPNKQLTIGYNIAGEYSVMQSVWQGHAFEPLQLNPNGGNVTIGNWWTNTPTGETLTLATVTNAITSAGDTLTGGEFSGNGGGLTGLQAIQVVSEGNGNSGSANNWFIGNAGRSAVTGSGNTGDGSGALLVVTTGANNTAHGYDALDQVTTGSGNTGDGYIAGFSLTSGSNNTFMGNGAGASIITGTNNFAAGTMAGSAWAGAESNNIAIQNAGVVGDIGQVRIGTAGQHTNLSFPVGMGLNIAGSQGTSGQYLGIDAGGHMIFGTPSGGGGVTPAYSSQFQTVSLGTGTATNVTDYPTNFASLFPYVAGVSPVAIQGVDSLTSGTGSGASGYSGVSNYLMFASNYYGLHFAASTNLSAGGEQLGTWSSNYTSILHPYAPGKGTNQFLFLWGGINDLSVYNETAEATYLFFTNIAYKAHQDGMIVVAMTCTYVATNTPAQAWETYRYNNYLRNSPTNWDYLVDVAAIIPPPSLNSNLYINNNSDGLAPDIVHITNAGQQFIAYEMSNVLSRAPHALTTKLQEPFVYGQVFTWATNNNNNTGNILYGNLAIKQSVGGLNYATRDLGTPYAQNGTWAGAGFDSGNSAYGFSCYFSQSVNFYGWLTAADAGTEFMSYCAMNGTNGVTFPNTSIYVQQSVVATNGFASYNTNVFTSVAPTSWSAQFSTINSGFTNIYGTNCTININGSVGYFVFYKGGGKTASTPAANPLFTNLLSTNGWSRQLRCGDGVQVVPSIGNANVTVDF